jgi:hypothetical protein
MPTTAPEYQETMSDLADGLERQAHEQLRKAKQYPAGSSLRKLKEPPRGDWQSYWRPPPFWARRQMEPDDVLRNDVGNRATSSSRALAVRWDTIPVPRALDGVAYHPEGEN